MEHAVARFILNCRTLGRRKAGGSLPVRSSPLEVEARLGVLQSQVPTVSGHPGRLMSSGAKPVGNDGNFATAFYCNANGIGAHFVGGISHGHAVHWTSGGLSENSPISAALGVAAEKTIKQIKEALEETELTETVYAGYKNNRRIAFPGLPSRGSTGKRERKEKMCAPLDLCLPSSPYDLRVGCAVEETEDGSVSFPPPAGYSTRRIKRRRSYTRKNKTFLWQLDITEVTTDGDRHSTQEIEMELSQEATVKLINVDDDQAATKYAQQLASQLKWMVDQINPSGGADLGSVEDQMKPHPDGEACEIAMAQLSSLKHFQKTKDWRGAVAPEGGASPDMRNDSRLKFIGCMPINFGRHNISEVQNGESEYFISEKTDGVRYLMVFTGKTVVLVDRAMKGNTLHGPPGKDPFAYLVPLIRPGTVFDGEVVLNRKFKRPVFIVFDVMCVGASQPVTDLKFSERLQHLKKASFRTKTANADMFGENLVKDKSVVCPLLRKNFVRRIDLDNLLSRVNEAKGIRTYVNSDAHCHLTDGIIFQPDTPYAMGTDVRLFKWKYLDTVTIDVEILPDHGGYYPGKTNEDNDTPPLRVAVVGDDGSMVDMTRHVRLPTSERMRLEADRAESGAKIAEVGFDPETGEWYYRNMRPDKVASNHISTVIGTILELAEGMGTVELRYRMSVAEGMRDTYRKEVRSMQSQLLDFQRKRSQQAQGRR